MATLGNVPAEAYTNTVKDSFSGNGSATAFTMSLPTVTNDVRVVVENVIQDPTVAYSVSGTTLTFTSAPPTGTNNIYVVHLGPAVMTTVPPAEIADATTFASSLTVQGAFTSKGIDDNADATAITIDSSERVMIGTTTEGQETADNLTIADTGHCGITLRSGASSVGTIFFSDATSGVDEYVGYVQYSHADNYMKWQTNGAERMRIDSSGKAGLGTASPTGSFHTTVKDSNGSDVYVVAQNTTSNRIAGFKVLDESGTNSLQMEYDNGSNEANIRNPNNGSLAIYLGGTGAANKLDDYEEGTWTPAVYQAGFTLSSFTARYTKIGRLVTVTCDCDLSGTGNGNDMKISGLPFTSLSAGHASGAGYTQVYPSAQNGSNAAFVPKSGSNDTFVYFQNGNGARYDGDRFSAGFLNFTITYFTS